jgi:hypothetical protein
MSTIGGKKREQIESQPKLVGLFEANVIAVNPTAQEFKEILNIELKEDSKAAEYLGEKDGNTTLRLDFWLKEVKNNYIFKTTFFLEDKEKENKDATKKQFINSVGVTSWAADSDSLPDWFVKREYRVAKNGEEDLYNFLRTWLGNLDYRDAETVLEIDWKSLMRGNVKALKDQVDGEWSTNIGCLATIKTVVKDEETKEYQSIYNKLFLPSYALKNFRLVNYNDERIVAPLKTKKPKDLKVHEKFVLSVTGEYGCKDFYVLKDLKEYDPSENLVSTNETITSDGSDY